MWEGSSAGKIHEGPAHGLHEVYRARRLMEPPDREQYRIPSRDPVRALLSPSRVRRWHEENQVILSGDIDLVLSNQPGSTLAVAYRIDIVF
jgi:hypothetical protein